MYLTRIDSENSKKQVPLHREPSISSIVIIFFFLSYVDEQYINFIFISCCLLSLMYANLHQLYCFQQSSLTLLFLFLFFLFSFFFFIFFFVN
jgi:hypothetical protein